MKLEKIMSSVNVAGDLDDEDLIAIGDQVVLGYESDKDSRKPWEKDLTNWTELALQIAGNKSYPWETVLVSLATLATETVFNRVGGVDGDLAKILGFLVAGGLTIFGGVLGFKVIMRLQVYLTISTLILTLGYIALTVDSIDWSAVNSIPSGNWSGFIKCMWWMPWRSQAMKDVVACDKRRGAGKRALIRRFPNGETHLVRGIPR